MRIFQGAMNYSLKNVFLQTKFQIMKRFLVILFVLSGSTFCVKQMSAQTSQVNVTAEQLGYYIGHQDGLKAGLMLAEGMDSAVIFEHIDAVNHRMEAAGGFAHRVKVVGTESVSENETKVTLSYECKNDKVIEVYYFLLIDNQWKWNGKKL